MRRHRLRAWVALALLAALTSSCAYYNTLYLARKNYYKGTDGAPYLVDKSPTSQAQFFSKSIDYSKKVIANYPKSKWVDDAYILWARSLLGQNDPLQTISMLQDFTTRFPNSQLGHEALFYLGVGYRQARKYNDALRCFDQFLEKKPRHDLAPYALLERGRVLMALQRPSEAADAATAVLTRFPKSKLALEARKARGDALFARGDYAGARTDFAYLGDRSLTSDDRLTWLLREADCLEGARDFDGSLALLKGAIGHEMEPSPPPAPPPGASSPQYSNYNPLAQPDGDHYGRLELRIGAAQTQAGRLDPALEAFRDVVTDYPRTPLASEAQYRIGYAYETLGDDFDKARAEYAKVKDMGSAGGFTDQATQRLGTLDRLAQFKGSGADSTEKFAETGLMRAEVYLFQQDKPERALQEYQKLAGELQGTPYEPQVLNAQAWVLGHKLDRRREADSLFWLVVRQHPATEAQLSARDYLEQDGADVPLDLIRMPERKLLARADTTQLTPTPLTDTRLGQAQMMSRDSTRLSLPAYRSALFGTQTAGPAVRPEGPASGPGGPGPTPLLTPGVAVISPADSLSHLGDPRRGSGGVPLAGARPVGVAPGAAGDSALLARDPRRLPGVPGLAGARPDSLAPATVATHPDSAARGTGPLPARPDSGTTRVFGPAPAPAPADSVAPAPAAPTHRGGRPRRHAPPTSVPAPPAVVTPPPAPASPASPAADSGAVARPDSVQAAPVVPRGSRPPASPDSTQAAPADSSRSRP